MAPTQPNYHGCAVLDAVQRRVPLPPHVRQEVPQELHATFNLVNPDWRREVVRGMKSSD